MSGDIHALSGAYVVDAVDDFERAQFERHLTGCSDCRLEVASLREGAALLAETVAQPAPDALRDRVLATVETVRPLPPLLADVQDRARANRRRFPAMVAVAAAFIVVGGVGATVWHPWDNQDGVTSVAPLPPIEQAPDARVLTSDVDGGGTVTLTWSASRNQAYVSTSNMPRLPDDETYQLWLIHDGKPVPAGLVDGNASKVLLDGDPATAQAAAITIEPAGGVDAPHKFVVASFDFTEA
ncbi:anti-sigma factor [soil metagenome]